MFGFVAASDTELDKAQRKRYAAVYCGICRQIREQTSNTARLGLSYDMAFLALLLMSLYEPEETGGDNACILHPIQHRPWIDNEYIRYGADMNVALAYYNAMDDYQDDKRPSAKVKATVFGRSLSQITERYPRQCQAMERCIAELSRLEKENCDSPDKTASCFGALMAELLVYREDIWSDTLRKMGMALGRYIYLADAAVDYRRDKRKNKYNPFLAIGTGEDWARWEQYLVLAMGRCTDYYERLPLVQDKAILDNILYSGIWVEYRRLTARKEKTAGGRK
ncbi:MAG: hypothetical protein IJZ15_00920 [Oscillospiraceae bacterium]|nr:hypothetical protein [Oscillospiraceae bacterium]